MPSKEKSSQEVFVEEYNSVVKQKDNQPFQDKSVDREWNESGDYFVKFSLYDERPMSFTSNNTTGTYC